MKKALKSLSMVVCAAVCITFLMTGCSNRDEGNNTTGQESGRNATTTATGDTGNLSDDMDDAADDIADGASDVADDVAGGFDEYDDAHDYLLDRLGTDNQDAKYEVRNKSEDTTEYQDGSNGYHFEIYDTSDGSGKKYGDFYVDKDTGKIYRKNTDTKKIEEYK